MVKSLIKLFCLCPNNKINNQPKNNKSNNDKSTNDKSNNNKSTNNNLLVVTEVPFPPFYM
jgi:hypothetical protein